MAAARALDPQWDHDDKPLLSAVHWKVFSNPVEDDETKAKDVTAAVKEQPLATWPLHCHLFDGTRTAEAKVSMAERERVKGDVQVAAHERSAWALLLARARLLGRAKTWVNASVMSRTSNLWSSTSSRGLGTGRHPDHVAGVPAWAILDGERGHVVAPGEFVKERTEADRALDQYGYALRIAASDSYLSRVSGEKWPKKGEHRRRKALCEPLSKLLGVTLLRANHKARRGKTAIDLVDKDLLVQVEVKNERDATGCDAAIEALQNFACSVSEAKCLGRHTALIVLAIADPCGPLFEFHIATMLDKPFMWQIDTMHIVRAADEEQENVDLNKFAALRRIVNALRDQRAQEADVASLSQHCFPQLTAGTTDGGSELNWFYAACLRPNVFRVTDTRTYEPYLLKIGRRCARDDAVAVHTWAARKGYAMPILAHDTHRMLLTRWAGGYKVAKTPTAEIVAKVRAIAKEMHDEGFVHGDLRWPNIMVNDAGDALLIDFDWAGREGSARFPPRLNKDIRWPDGAVSGSLITMAHDDAMLDAFEALVDVDDTISDTDSD